MADDIGGVWRTVGGRRIFIKDGQDLETAMKESGKFKKTKATIKKEENIKELEEKHKEAEDKIYDIYNEIYDAKRQINKLETEYLQERSKYLKKNFPELEKNTPEYYEIREKYDKKNRENYEKKSKQYIENKNKLEREYTKSKNQYNEIEKLMKEKRGLYSPYEQQLRNYLKKDASGYEQIANRLIQTKNTQDFEKYVKFGKLAKENDFVISESPYGSSMYAIPKGDVVEWGYKPTGSYRIADHWSFESQGGIHCKLNNSDEYSTKFTIGKWNGKYYEEV